MELPIEAAFPWTIQVFEGGELIDSELHRTRDAAEEAVLSYEEDDLTCRIVPTTRGPSLLDFVRSIRS
jgi:hypothetical protein